MRQWKWKQPRRLPQRRMWLWCRRRNDRDYLHVSCGVQEWRKDIARWKRSSFTAALLRRRLVFHGSIWESWIDFSVLWKSARAILPANWTWKGTSLPFTQTRNRSGAACVRRRSTDWTTSDSTSNEFTKMRFNWARLQAMPSMGVATMQKWTMGMWSRRLIFLVLIPKRWSKLSHRTISTDEVEQQYHRCTIWQTNVNMKCWLQCGDSRTPILATLGKAASRLCKFSSASRSTIETYFNYYRYLFQQSLQQDCVSQSFRCNSFGDIVSITVLIFLSTLNMFASLRLHAFCIKLV